MTVVYVGHVIVTVHVTVVCVGHVTVHATVVCVGHVTVHGACDSRIFGSCDSARCR